MLVIKQTLIINKNIHCRVFVDGYYMLDIVCTFALDDSTEHI